MENIVIGNLMLVSFDSDNKEHLMMLKMLAKDSFIT